MEKFNFNYRGWTLVYRSSIDYLIDLIIRNVKFRLSANDDFIRQIAVKDL